MNINIISIGSIKEKYFVDAIKEYSKRLRIYINLNINELQEYKLPNNPSNSQILEGLEKEGKNIISQINTKSYIISLCIEGKQKSSEEFSKNIGDLMLEGYSDITFIIGGSYGLSDEVKSRSNMKLSFSKMTYPHQLMRVILLEQIYRAFKIIKNEPYHK